MYSIHPLVVHFPLGLLLTNGLLTALYLRWRSPVLESTAYLCLWLGWLCVLPAVVSGTYAAARYLFGPDPRADALGWINAHAAVALALLVVYWQAWQMRRRHPAILDDPLARRGYGARLALGAALLLAEGWLGGQMVYELGVGVGVR